QAIAEVYGGKLFNLTKPVHGTASLIRITDKTDPLFEELPERFLVGRYHSWAVSPENFPEELKITAVDETNVIMALSHKTFDVKGLQFHPESILSEHGKQIINNWLKN